MPATPLVWGMRAYLHTERNVQTEASHAPEAHGPAATASPSPPPSPWPASGASLQATSSSSSSPAAKREVAEGHAAVSPVPFDRLVAGGAALTTPSAGAPALASCDPDRDPLRPRRRPGRPPSPRWDRAAFEEAFGGGEISGAEASFSSSKIRGAAEVVKDFAEAESCGAGTSQSSSVRAAAEGDPLLAIDTAPSTFDMPVVLFRVCGERVVVPATTRRCHDSLLATLVGSRTAIPIARNGHGEIEITSSSSVASFRLLAWFITEESTERVPHELTDAVFAAASSVEEVLGTVRMDVEYFLGSSQENADLNDLAAILQQGLLSRGYSMGDWLWWHDAPKELSLRQLNLRPNLRSLQQVDPLLGRRETALDLQSQRLHPPQVDPSSSLLLGASFLLS